MCVSLTSRMQVLLSCYSISSWNCEETDMCMLCSCCPTVFCCSENWKQSAPEVFSLSLRVKMRALWQNWAEWEQVWPPLNSLRELVCMHQWLTGSWAPDNHPLLQALLLHCWQWLGRIVAEIHSYSTYYTFDWELSSTVTRAKVLIILWWVWDGQYLFHWSSQSIKR